MSVWLQHVACVSGLSGANETVRGAEHLTDDVHVGESRDLRSRLGMARLGGELDFRVGC